MSWQGAGRRAALLWRLVFLVSWSVTAVGIRRLVFNSFIYLLICWFACFVRDQVCSKYILQKSIYVFIRLVIMRLWKIKVVGFQYLHLFIYLSYKFVYLHISSGNNTEMVYFYLFFPFILLGCLSNKTELVYCNVFVYLAIR